MGEQAPAFALHRGLETVFGRKTFRGELIHRSALDERFERFFVEIFVGNA